MQKEEKALCNSSNSYNVQNMYVRKDRICDFIDFRINNAWLKDCSIRQLIPSGKYFIYTFNITISEQRAEIKKNQKDWL